MSAVPMAKATPPSTRSGWRVANTATMDVAAAPMKTAG